MLKQKILVTTGSTWVSIDKVRVMTNIFGGRTGYEIACYAAALGHNVTLLMGPCRFSINKNTNVKIRHFKYFDELYALMKEELTNKKYDIVIHSAAVSDFKPVKTHKTKLSSDINKLNIEFKPTQKIVNRIKKWNSSVLLVKFKLEVNVSTKRLFQISYNSLKKSNADFVVANKLEGMFANNHVAYIIDKNRNILKVKNHSELSKKLIEICTIK